MVTYKESYLQRRPHFHLSLFVNKNSPFWKKINNHRLTFGTVNVLAPSPEVEDMGLDDMCHMHTASETMTEVVGLVHIVTQPG